MKEACLVRDCVGNEIYFGETIGECQRWCKDHGIDGCNGEYIALGKFDDVLNYFETVDYVVIINES